MHCFVFISADDSGVPTAAIVVPILVLLMIAAVIATVIVIYMKCEFI